MTVMTHSAIYSGWVRHRRYFPRAHHFRYRGFQLYLDLDELESGKLPWCLSREAFNVISFRRRDFFAPEIPSLKQAVRARMQELTGSAPAGAIRLLGHLRYFGHCFNPVVFYYGFDAGDRLTHIMAEITNTPWGERHQYAFELAKCEQHGSAWHMPFDKAFHVSPFLPMGLNYDWRFAAPGDAIRIHMDVRVPDGRKQFDASFVLDSKKDFRTGNLLGACARFPFATLAVVWRIYWHALRLKLKGVPFFDHPVPKD
jgi:hypothetical protein